MRTRTRGSISHLPGQVQRRHIWDGCAMTAWTVTANLPGGDFGETELMIDEVVPNYHKRVQNGEVFFNDMYKETKTVSSFGGSGCHGISVANGCNSPANKHEFKLTGDWFLRQISPPGLGGPTVTGVLSETDIDAMRSAVSTKVLSKRGRSDSDSWEAVAELGKTARILSGLARKAITIINARSARDGGDAAAAASDLWLRYRYGLRPIIKDIEAVIAGIQREPRSIRKTTRATETMFASANSTGSIDHDHFRDNYSIITTDSITVRAMSLEEYDVTRANDLGFTTKSLLTLPWELLPYSFVADWFVNVGDYIGAYAPAPGYNNLGSCIVENRVTSTMWKPTGYTSLDGLYNMVTPTSGGVMATVQRKHRHALCEPRLRVQPDFKLDEFLRAADAMALVGQLLHRKLRSA